jgi:hypothetical protein
MKRIALEPAEIPVGKVLNLLRQGIVMLPEFGRSE